MTALWLSLIIAFILVILLISKAVGSTAESLEIKKNSILYIELSGSFNERAVPLDFQDMLEGNALPQSWDDVMNAIRLASEDKNIDGIYLNCVGSEMGIASREEMLEALLKFKESGKWIYAYANSYYQGDYYLASCADKIVLNPCGALDLHGIATSIPFFKGLLDKLDINIQVIKVGTFKSAVEPLILDEISEPAKLQTQIFIDSIWNNITTTMASLREVETSTVRNWADSLVFAWPAEKVLESKAVTELAYEREAMDYLKGITGVKQTDELRLVTPASYILSKKMTKSIFAEIGKKKHIAVLFAFGDIVDYGKAVGEISSDYMVPQIIKLADDPNVEGMVLRVNSGGGSAFASEQIWEALEYFKSKGKPLYVSMGDYAASGGYYISCCADKIYADANTLTGSIGVLGIVPDLSKLAKNIGINFSTVESNPNAITLDPFKPMSPQLREAMQRQVDNTYELFTSRVAKGRNIPQDSVKIIAEGRVWVATTAKQLGLVDEIGSLETCIEDMCNMCTVKRNDVYSYPELQPTIWNEIFNQLSTEMAKTALAGDKVIKEGIQTVKFINRLNKMNRYQARMPEIIIR